MKKKLLLIISICTFLGNAHGQSKIQGLPFEWELNLGGGYFNASNLKALTDEQDVKGIPRGGLNIAGSVSYRLGNVILGGSASNLGSLRKESQLSVTTVSAYVSTNALQFGKWIFSPAVGLGPQFTTAVLNKDNPIGDFTEYLGVRSNQTRLNHTVAALDLSLTFKTYNLLTATYRPQFRIGYQSGINQSVWKVGNATLANAPRDRTSMFYLQLSTGIGR